MEEGSLYPALHRMERRGWIAAEWGLSEANRRAKYYALTAAGRAQLKAEVAAWSRFVEAVLRRHRRVAQTHPGRVRRPGGRAGREQHPGLGAALQEAGEPLAGPEPARGVEEEEGAGLRRRQPQGLRGAPPRPGVAGATGPGPRVQCHDIPSNGRAR